MCVASGVFFDLSKAMRAAGREKQPALCPIIRKNADTINDTAMVHAAPIMKTITMLSGLIPSMLDPMMRSTMNMPQDRATVLLMPLTRAARNAMATMAIPVIQLWPLTKEPIRIARIPVTSA